MKNGCPHHHHSPGKTHPCPAAEPLPRLELSALTGQLRRGAHKITGPRAAILELLRDERHPLTNREIFQRLPRGECNLATVYRAIQLLERLGMVRRFDFGDGTARYELVRGSDAEHHHHLVCTCCAAVVELDECFAAEIQQRIAQSHRYQAVTHRLEFFGICPACQGG